MHRRSSHHGLLAACCVLLCVVLPARAAQHAAAVASAHPLATDAGIAVLADGGNAFDAAISVCAVLAVVEPYSSGLGGGGFWLLHRADDGYQTMLDARETAPLAARRDMYLDDDGKVVPGLTVDGALAAAIPGVPAALVHLAEHYGKLPLTRTLAPAIRLARAGFVVDADYVQKASFRLQALRRDAAAAAVFLHHNEVPPPGHRIRQQDLAATLETLAQQGHAGFYRGEVAGQLVAGVSAAGGIWTAQDLAQYRVIEREPVRGSYQGYTITSAALPSSGGIVLVSMLNMLSGYPLQKLVPFTRTHLLVEVMRRAYRDRAEYLGDADFVDVPVGELTGVARARQLTASIHPGLATSSASLPDVPLPAGGSDTTHYSVLDREGNRVAATLSVNYPFGAAVVAPGTGVLLNDEMDDFSVRPGVPNLYGLTGAAANAIEPGKRPLSSMTPTFVENGQRLAILGTPGGSRIISMVLLGILDFVDGNDPESMVGLPRFHHQYLPDRIEYEPDALDADMRRVLERRGHELSTHDGTWGNMQVISLDRVTGEVQVASDPRGHGSARVSGSRVEAQ